MPAPNLRGFIVVAAFAVTIAGCESSDRPDAASWLAAWQEIIDVVPDQGDLGEIPDQALCQDILADLREKSEGLTPAPSVTVDDLASEWVSIAEAAFFECPPQEPDLTSFADAYEEMDRIEQSVETALNDSDG